MSSRWMCCTATNPLPRGVRSMDRIGCFGHASIHSYSSKNSSVTFSDDVFSFLDRFLYARHPTRARVNVGRVGMVSPTRAHRARAVSNDATRVLVVGSSRGSGLAVVRRLLRDSAFFVVASMQVGSDGTKLSELGMVAQSRGDAREERYVKDLFVKAMPDVVVSCLGGKVGDCRRADYTGNRCLIDAAMENEVKKFVLLSSIGAGDSELAIPGPSKDAVMPLMMDKTRAEIYLRESSISNTFILRAGPLYHREGGDPILSNCPTAYGELSYDSLAECVHHGLSKGEWWGKTYSAVDRDRVYVSNPYVRPLESFEPIPFPVVEI